MRAIVMDNYSVLYITFFTFFMQSITHSRARSRAGPPVDRALPPTCIRHRVRLQFGDGFRFGYGNVFREDLTLSHIRDALPLILTRTLVRFST